MNGQLITRKYVITKHVDETRVYTLIYIYVRTYNKCYHVTRIAHAYEHCVM